jgi:hypothetical protein
VGQLAAAADAPWKWHATHDFALNTCPSPSPPARGSWAVHSCSNNSRPGAMSAALADGPKTTGSPAENSHQYPAARTVTPAPRVNQPR